MMELSNWQSQKILATQVNQTICQDNILSDKLLQILDISDDQKQKDICEQISQ